MGLDEDFFGFDTKRKGNKSKNRHTRLHPNKKVLHSKRNYKNMKRKPVEWERTCANHTGVNISKIYKELL